MYRYCCTRPVPVFEVWEYDDKLNGATIVAYGVAIGSCWRWPWRGCPTRAVGTHSASAPTIWTTDVQCPFDPLRYVELPVVWPSLGGKALGRHASRRAGGRVAA